MARSLARLWVSGVAVDWERYYHGEKRHKLALPTYPFERQRYWIEAGADKSASPASSFAAPLEKKMDLSDWFYAPSWKRSASPELHHADATTRQFLVFADECGLGARLAAWLAQHGHATVTVKAGERFRASEASTYEINPQAADDYQKLLKELRLKNILPNHIVHLWTVTSDDPQSQRDLKQRGFYSLISLAQALGDQMIAEPLQLDIVSNGLQDVIGDENIEPEKATILGPRRVIPQEYPNISCRSIDVVLSSAEPLVENLAAEILCKSTDSLVAYRGNHRWVDSLEAVKFGERPAGDTPLKTQGVYLITGGVGGIGLVLAEHLAEQFQAKLTLTARTPLPAREVWDSWLAGHDEKDATSKKIRKIQSLEKLGAECLVMAADVSDKAAMQNVIEETRRKFGAIHGVIHAAGVPGGGMIQVKTREAAERILAPKLQGTANLVSLLRDVPLDMFLLCSSITAIQGGLGQVDYCAANCYLDAVARSGKLRNCISINWDAWQEVGMAADFKMPADLAARRRAELEAVGIRPKEGIEVFVRLIGTRLRQVIVCTRNLLPYFGSPARAEAGTEQKALAVPDPLLHPRPALQGKYVAPRNDIESSIAETWQQLLGIEQIGIHDNFFELGGHSLLATQVVSRLRESLKVELPLRTLFEASTIAELSGRIAGMQQAPAGAPDVAAILEELERMSEEEAQQLLSARVNAPAGSGSTDA